MSRPAVLGGVLQWYAAVEAPTRLLCGMCITRRDRPGPNGWRRLTRHGVLYRLRHWGEEARQCEGCDRTLSD